VEVLREIFYRVNVGTDGVLSVVATLKFIQHQLPETGHSHLLVTQNLHQRKCSGGDQRGSVRRASGLVVCWACSVEGESPLADLMEVTA
jgi:hypothetical protein